jgi:hypothetical protein
MRANIARAVSTSRRHERAQGIVDRRVSPVVARRTTCARAGLQLAGGCATFFVAYVTLSLLHAFGNDPTLVVALAPIPLFARFLASAACALPAGLALGFVVRDRALWLRRAPALLAAVIALFVVVIVFVA